MANKYKNFDLKECDLVHVTWLDAFDALGTGWHEWDDIEKKAVLFLNHGNSILDT